MDGTPESTPGASQGTGQPPTAPPTRQPPAGPAPAPQPPDPKNDQPQDVASLPEWAQKLISDTRAEAAQHRTAGKTAAQAAAEAKAQRDAILKAMGLDPDGKDTPPDPAKLAKQYSDAQAVAWENGTQVAILRAAPSVGADADALLDSNTFLDSLGDFVDDDPTTTEFRTRMSKHIKDFVAKHPKFKAAPAGPVRSGGDLSGGPGGNPNTRPKSLREAYARQNRG